MEREKATQEADLPHMPVLAKGPAEGDRCAVVGCDRAIDDPIHQPRPEQAAAEPQLERELGT